MIASATMPDGVVKGIKANTILEKLSGEEFRDDIASFVDAEIDEMRLYRDLVYARARWSVWAKRISKGVRNLMILQGVFAGSFLVAKVLSRTVAPRTFLATFVASALAIGFCIVCASAMQIYYDKISEYRDKIL